MKISNLIKNCSGKEGHKRFSKFYSTDLLLFEVSSPRIFKLSPPGDRQNLVKKEICPVLWEP